MGNEDTIISGVTAGSDMWELPIKRVNQILIFKNLEKVKFFTFRFSILKLKQSPLSQDTIIII